MNVPKILKLQSFECLQPVWQAAGLEEKVTKNSDVFLSNGRFYPHYTNLVFELFCHTQVVLVRAIALK